MNRKTLFLAAACVATCVATNVSAQDAPAPNSGVSVRMKIGGVDSRVGPMAVQILSGTVADLSRQLAMCQANRSVDELDKKDDETLTGQSQRTVAYWKACAEAANRSWCVKEPK